MSTHDEVSDDDCGEEERDADLRGDPHAVPHGLDPLPAEHPEDDHEAVHEVHKVPTRELLLAEQVHVVC